MPLNSGSLYNFLKDSIIRDALPSNFNLVRFSELYGQSMDGESSMSSDPRPIECDASKTLLYGYDGETVTEKVGRCR